MLKPSPTAPTTRQDFQPPSGGCVLKQRMPDKCIIRHHPAAFRRLCVETAFPTRLSMLGRQPPSGGCVLKRYASDTLGGQIDQPPSGGCVLKLNRDFAVVADVGQPPSGGCVLKPVRRV